MTNRAPTMNEVLVAIDAAGVRQPRELLRYIHGDQNPHRNRILAAVNAGDAHALASYCAAAVSQALQGAGYRGQVPAGALKALSSLGNGWQLIHDVADGRENAAQHLSYKIESLRARAAEAANASAQPPAGPSQRAPAPPAPQRREQAAHSHPNAPVRREGQPQGQQQAPQRPQGSGRTYAAPPRRVGEPGNVRQIGEARQARRAQQGEEESNALEARFDQVKVYGSKAALSLEATTNRGGDPTINIEAAKMLNPQARTYAWNEKIIIQLTGTELQHMTCLLLGLINQVKFQNHGPESDKWFEVERQTGQYAGTIKFAVGKGKDMCLVQLTAADIGNVVALFVRTCSKQLKIKQEALGMVLRPVAQAVNDTRARQGMRQARAAG